MDTTTSVVATGVVVTAGHWSQNQKLSINMIVGIGFTAGFLAVLQSSNQKFAEKFATAILVGAVFMYALPIAKKLGVLAPDNTPQGKFIGPISPTSPWGGAMQ